MVMKNQIAAELRRNARVAELVRSNLELLLAVLLTAGEVDLATRSTGK